MIDDQYLRDTARGLALMFRLLESKKFDAPPPREARAMRPAPGPQAPVASWITSAEDCLLEERRDEKIPGGLRVIVTDAAAHIHTPIPREGTRPTGAELCDYVAWNAHVIALDFPAADDLGDLMVQQAKWLSRKLNPTSSTAKVKEAVRHAERWGTAAELAVLLSASLGRNIDGRKVTSIGRGKAFSKRVNADGLKEYKLNEMFDYLHK